MASHLSPTAAAHSAVATWMKDEKEVNVDIPLDGEEDFLQ